MININKVPQVEKRGIVLPWKPIRDTLVNFDSSGGKYTNMARPIRDEVTNR